MSGHGLWEQTVEDIVKGVSLTDFVDSQFVDDQDAEFIGDQGELATMSLELVVRQYAKQERARCRDGIPEGRAEVRAHSTAWPVQLISSLDKYSVYTDAQKSRATLTKCGVYPISRWFVEVLKLERLTVLHQEVDSAIRQIPDLHLMTTLSDRLSALVYPGPEMEHKSRAIAIVGWFHRRAITYANALGTSYTALVGAGYEWWLTTTMQADIDPTNITQRYYRDARILEVYANERFAELKHIKSIALSRSKIAIVPPRIVGGRIVE